MLANFALSTSMRIALLVLIFLFVVVIVMLASNYLLNRSAVRGRLDELGSGNRGTGEGASLRRDRIAVGWAKLTDRIEKAGISLVDSQGDKLRAQLVAAGYTSPTAPKLFTLIRMITLFLLPGLLLLYIFVSGIEVSAL